MNHETISTKRPLPRMRLIKECVAEIKALDPGTAVTEYYIRGLVKTGKIPVAMAGNKALINLDGLLNYLANPETVAEPSGTIRRVSER